MSDREGYFEFPCTFPIKIMGRANVEFEVRILAILRKHTPDLGEAAIRIRHSKEGTYMSITALIPAKSKQQLDAIYQELSSEKTVLVVL
jgi:putative lipoic acid-binding regulatory protein